MKAYQTDNLGFLISEVNAQESPLEPGEFLLPAGATFLTPPNFSKENNHIPKFDFKTNTWSIAPNFSGRKFYHKTTLAERYFAVGEELDKDFTSKEPLSEDGKFLPFQKFENGNWILDNDLKLSKMKELHLSKVKSIFENKRNSYRGIVTVNGQPWDSGAKYLDNIEKVLSISSKGIPGFTLPAWRNANNENLQLDLQALIQIRDAIEIDMFLEGSRLYQIKWTKEAEIEALHVMFVHLYDPYLGWD
jgi:hypothetical protein